ncbi:hypothetical protein [Streptomyces sp. NPDC059979]|uniref:hypothetical protein n=1 Tax=Streptomyces sp. NPDC059979 TaxID=3347021 RepID=UPI00368834C1
MHDVQHPAAAGGIFDRLDADWAALCADPAVRQAVTDWLTDDHLADGIAAVTDSWTRALGPAQLLAALRPVTGTATDPLTDAILRALLRRAAGRDRSAELAARVIVQAMLPAAVRITRGQVRPTYGRTRDTVGHVTVAALYEVARSGRIHHRPGRAASNLTLDTLRLVLAELAAEQGSGAEHLSAAAPLVDTAPSPYRIARAHEVHAAAAAAGVAANGPDGEHEKYGARVEVLELLLDAMEDGALSAADAKVLARHYLGGVPDAEAAARVGSTPGAWQRRRSRALARLRTSRLRAAA